MEEAKCLEKQENSLAHKVKPASAQGELKESLSFVPLLSLNQNEGLKKAKEVPSTEKEPEVVLPSQLKVAKPLEKSVEKSQGKIDTRIDPSLSGECSSLTLFKKNSTKLGEAEVKRKIPEAKKEPVSSKEISLATVPNESNPQQKLNKTLSLKTLNIDIKKEEPNCKDQSTEARLKTQTEAEVLKEAMGSTTLKEETIKLKPTQDPMTAETSQAAQQRMKKPKDTTTGETSQAAQDQMKKPKDPEMNAPKKQLIQEAVAKVPDVKVKKDLQEYINGIEGMENAKQLNDAMLENERRKNYRNLLTEISQASSVTTLNSSSTAKTVVVAILQQSAKQLYNRKATILRENYKYRMGLLNQLRHAMKTNYKSEAQQLFFDYHSTRRRTQNIQNLDTTDIHLDFKESKVIVTSEKPMEDLHTLG